MARGFTRWEAPLRLASGGFILQQALAKRDLPAEGAQGLHEFAKAAELPLIDDLESEEFIDLLSMGEAAVGGLLLAPFVPRRIAGLALMGFSGLLLRLYWKAPGQRQPGSITPTPDGLPLAKDLWLFAIGLALFVAGSRRKEREGRKARKAGDRED